ncbi:hypothetical protein [Neobacillus niacini]|uniref:hypothetical protein n=1 Tax=Neobacillus niacini TaxID=86668 RepID=UPI00203CAEF1|nr:hypothetical protein [Neobacillus niacini]MCM3690783.1 hypothetical protein [Neobacillus niacini]
MPVVSIVSIFTRGARSSETPELRNARVQGDIQRANEVWGTGNPPGVACGITFVSHSLIYRPEVTINASTVTSSADPRIMQVIDEARAATNFATAIYVVYLSGETFNGGHVGNAGPVVDNVTNTNLYSIYGRCSLSDGAFETYLLAHEVGHILFYRILSLNPIVSTINDPSNPGDDHNNDPQNIMFPFVPAMNPYINGGQCTVARQNRIILENAQFTGVNQGTALIGTGSGFATQNQFNSMEDNESIDNFESGNQCSCNNPQHHHSNSKIVKKLNEIIDSWIEDMGPERPQIYPKPPQIYPKPPKKKKKDSK